jgi:lambda family phage tail tape measure protein
MANFIGRLGVILGLDSAEFQKGIQQANRQLDQFVDKARNTATLGAAAFAAMAYQAMQLADEISDTAKANDIAVDSVLKLRNALAVSGGEADNAGKLLSTFTANIDKAAEGSFEVQKTLKGLGISLQDLRTMSIDQLLTKSLDGLAKMEDPLTRNAKAMELFGKAAKGVDFASLNSEIANGAGVTDKQAKAIEDAAAAYDTLAQAGRDFSVMLATELGPSLKTTFDYLGGFKEVLSGVGSVFRTVFETIVVLGANVAFVFKGIAEEISHTIENAKLLAKLDFKGATAANQAYDLKNYQRRLELEQFERKILGIGSRGEGFDDPRLGGATTPESKTGSTTKRTVKPGVDKEAEAERKRMLALRVQAFKEQLAEQDELNKALAEQQTMFQKGNADEMMRQKAANIELDRAKEMLVLVHEGRNMRAEDLQLAQELKEVEWKRQDAIEKINSNQALDANAREKALERENQLAQKAVDLAQKRNELARQTREGTLSEGFFKAMDDAARNAATSFQMGQQVFQSVMGNMEAAIDQFVRTGKFAFKDFAASVIRDLIAMQLKAQATFLLRTLIGSFAPSPMAMTSQQFVAASGGRVFADGGEPPVGMPSIVGERGPELFVPRTAGTIIPNHRLSSVTGQQSQPAVIYNGPYIANMSAIDTQSGLQFLAKNKQAVWSANQSAQRSLAMSR